jgi:AraC-like DNA-binding protein
MMPVESVMLKAKQRGSAFAFRGVPRVIDLGYVRDVPGHATRLLDFSVLGLVTAGEVGIEVGSERLAVSAGSYYLLPGLIPHHGLGASRFDVVFFHFLSAARPDDAGLPAVELALTGPTSPLVDYSPLFRLLESQYRTGLLDGDELGVQLLAIAGQLAALQRRRPAHPTASADSAHALARSVLELLHAEYAAELSGPAISARLGYSYAYLERVFRAAYDRSIHQELLRTRIQVAAHGLQMGKSIKDIAREVGFGDYYYFLKAFKRVKGVSPGVFQASYRAGAHQTDPRPVQPGIVRSRVRDDRPLPRWIRASWRKRGTIVHPIDREARIYHDSCGSACTSAHRGISVHIGVTAHGMRPPH